MGLKKRLKDAAPRLRTPAVIAYIALFAVVLAGVVLFVVYRDDIDNRTLSGIIDFFRFGKNEESFDEVRFDAGGRNIYALCGDKFIVLSPERLVLYGADGTERLSRSLMYEQPALCVSGSKAVVFDRMGTGCVITDGKEIVSQPEGQVMAASGNGRGGYALVTSVSGYRGVATVYGSDDRQVYKWYSGEGYITAVGLSPSGKGLTVAAVSQSAETAETAETTLTFLATDSPDPLAKVSIPGELALSVTYPDNTHVCVVTENGAYFYTDDGKTLGSYDFGERMILGVYPTDENLFFLLGHYENGMYSRLYCLGYEGKEKASYYIEEAPRALSAEGMYCSAVTGGLIVTYDNSGGVVRELAGWPDTQKICQLADGGVIAVGGESAELVPLEH